MSSSTPTPSSVSAVGRPSSYQVKRSPSTEPPMLRPSTSLIEPENPIQRPPSSLWPMPSLVIATWKPKKSRLYWLGRWSQPPSMWTLPPESIESAWTWKPGQSSPPTSGVSVPLSVAVNVPPLSWNPRLSSCIVSRSGLVNCSSPALVVAPVGCTARTVTPIEPSRPSSRSTPTGWSKNGSVIVPVSAAVTGTFCTKSSSALASVTSMPNSVADSAGVQVSVTAPVNPPLPM